MYTKTVTIKDSGSRRVFDTGAVRDIQEGKGRCDLLPLDVVSKYLLEYTTFSDSAIILTHIDMFTKTGDVKYLYDALFSAGFLYANCIDMFLEVSKHFEAGAQKYGEFNWQKGIPTHCYIDSAIRHLFKYMREDEDEPHDRVFIWNIMCCIWTCINMPSQNDYRIVHDENENDEEDFDKDMNGDAENTNDRKNDCSTHDNTDDKTNINNTKYIIDKFMKEKR